jgi:glycosyltransferase involved in cell wall biosynthesis
MTTERTWRSAFLSAVARRAKAEAGPAPVADRPSRVYRLAAVTAHPVQYQAPLFRRVAAHPAIDLTVFYGDDRGAEEYFDGDFGRSVQWDRPLLDGYRSVFLRRRRLGPGALARFAADVGVVGRLWRGRFDAVLIHSYATRLSLCAYLGAFISRTPVLLRTESENLRPRRRLVQLLKSLLLWPLFAGTAAFLVIGEANRRFFERFGIPRSRQFSTPYSVDNEYFSVERRRLEPSRREIRSAFGWDDDVVIIGFSGKLIPLKRVADLVDAVSTLQREGTRAGLLIVGDGPERNALADQIQCLGLKWTVLAGFRNQSELPHCYVAMDVFALLSTSETWGLVLNEAMLFGLPVMATDRVGASLDLIAHGRNGFIVPVGDVPVMTGLLRQLVRSAPMRREFGEDSEAVVQRYSYDECVKGVLAALRQVAAGPQAVATAPAPERLRL